MRFVGFILILAVGLYAQDEVLTTPDLPVEVAESPETFLADPIVEESAPVVAVSEPTTPPKSRRGCKNCKPRKKNANRVTEEVTSEIAK